MTIDELAGKLGITPASLERMRRRYQMKHGAEADAKLTSWLEQAWGECRERVRIPARQNGLLHPTQYVSDPAGGLDGEPESVPAEYQDVISVDARTRRAEQQERAAEQQKAQLRSFTEAMRHKIRKGEDIGPRLARALEREEDAA